MLRYIPSISISLRAFIMKVCEFCQMLFLHLLSWLYHFNFLLLMWGIILICRYWAIVASLEYTPTWSWYMSLLMYCWVQFPKILLRTFTSMFIRDMYFYLLGVSLSGFDIRLVLLLSYFSHVWLFVTQWTVARQAPLPMGFSRQAYWSGLPFPSPEGIFQPRNWTQVSCIVGRFFINWATKEAY